MQKTLQIGLDDGSFLSLWNSKRCTAKPPTERYELVVPKLRSISVDLRIQEHIAQLAAASMNALWDSLPERSDSLTAKD